LHGKRKPVENGNASRILAEIKIKIEVGTKIIQFRFPRNPLESEYINKITNNFCKIPLAAYYLY
jgi:hypothetical protein